MTPAYLAAVAGMLAAGGVAGLLLAILRPAPPQLAAVLGQLNAPSVQEDEPVSEAGAIIRSISAQVGVPDADLNLLGMDRTELALQKLVGLLAGVSLLPALSAILWALGSPLDVGIPAVGSLALGLLGWRVPSTRAIRAAGQRREEFIEALNIFTGLVALERVTRGAPIEALDEASRVSDQWPFVLIRQELHRAELSSRSPWGALDDLGARIGIEELQSLARIVSSSAEDGASIFNSLLAESRQQQSAALAKATKAAGEATEKLSLPIGLCAIACMLLMAYPAFTRI